VAESLKSLKSQDVKLTVLKATSRYQTRVTNKCKANVEDIKAADKSSRAAAMNNLHPQYLILEIVESSRCSYDHLALQGSCARLPFGFNANLYETLGRLTLHVVMPLFLGYDLQRFISIRPRN
jgi:hypothetical protein